MQLAREQNRINSPIQLYLRLKQGAHFETTKSRLEKTYKAKTLGSFYAVRTLQVEVPVRNLKRLVEDNSITMYEWPGILEVNI